jgi:GAF domain-containing protein
MSEENSARDAAPARDRLDEAGTYRALSRIVLADRTLTEVLEEVALLAKQVLPEDPEVSVTLLEGDQPHTAAFTGALAIQLDERQYDTGFGPCLDAAVAGQRINLALDDPDNPYSDFCRLARSHGVTHSMSVGFPVATPTVGGLNLYSSTGQPFSEHSERVVGTFASFAGIVLASAGLRQDLAELAAQLEAAVQSRAVIDQAKGILMAENRCSEEAAFRLLVRASQTRNIKLRLLAQQIVSSVSAPASRGGR